jgi:hypothetical protein
MFAGNHLKLVLSLWFYHESIKFGHSASPICALLSPSTKWLHPRDWTFTGCCLQFPTKSSYRNSLHHVFTNFYPPYLWKILPQGRFWSWWFRKWSSTARSASQFSGINKTVIVTSFRFSSLKGSREGLECAVYLSKFEDIEILRLLPQCKHAFYINCVISGLKNIQAALFAGARSALRTQQSSHIQIVCNTGGINQSYN